MGTFAIVFMEGQDINAAMGAMITGQDPTARTASAQPASSTTPTKLVDFWFALRSIAYDVAGPAPV